MSSNRLKLNADKTEFIWLGTLQKLSKVVATPLLVKDKLLQPTDKVRDLGVLIDSQLTMEPERRPQLLLAAAAVSQHPAITPADARRTLAAAFIASRVDYYNGVLYGVSSQIIGRLFADCVINIWNSLPSTVIFFTLASFRRTTQNVDFSRFMKCS